MKKIAIIPARSGSKRIKNKNITFLGGRPLVEWTINAAIDSRLFDEIVLSTDSVEIQNIGRRLGLPVKELRPETLSGDFTTASEVISYHLKNESEGYACYLQPTSPLRTSCDIVKSWQVLRHNNAKSVVSIGESGTPAEWIYRIGEDFGKYLEVLSTKRSQDLNPIYSVNGAIYWFSIQEFHKFGTHLGLKPSLPYIMTRESGIDIDTPYDFRVAEALIGFLE